MVPVEVMARRGNVDNFVEPVVVEQPVDLAAIAQSALRAVDEADPERRLPADRLRDVLLNRFHRIVRIGLIVVDGHFGKFVGEHPACNPLPGMGELLVFADVFPADMDLLQQQAVPGDQEKFVRIAAVPAVGRLHGVIFGGRDERRVGLYPRGAGGRQEQQAHDQ